MKKNVNFLKCFLFILDTTETMHCSIKQDYMPNKTIFLTPVFTPKTIPSLQVYPHPTKKFIRVFFNVRGSENTHVTILATKKNLIKINNRLSLSYTHGNGCRLAHGHF